MKLGVIGGTGLERLELGVPYVPRHGPNHEYLPHEVPYLENLQWLQEHGCTHVLSFNACGSLREHLTPGTMVVPDQVLDFTHRTDSRIVGHLSAAMPFDAEFGRLVQEVHHLRSYQSIVAVVVEGPRFATRAESRLYRMMGGDVISMTIAPECFVAKFLGLKYISVCLITDFDCWDAARRPVTYEEVQARMASFADRIPVTIQEVNDRLV